MAMCNHKALALVLTWPIGTGVGIAKVSVWSFIGVVVCNGADVAARCGVGSVAMAWHRWLGPIPFVWCVEVGSRTRKASY